MTSDTSLVRCAVRPIGMSENMTVLVTGASGTLGSAVLPRLAKAGYEVGPMSRGRRTGWVTADLRTGPGLAEAVRGVDAIVHLEAQGSRRPICRIHVPGRMSRAIRDGGQLTKAAPAGTRAWQDYLAARY